MSDPAQNAIGKTARNERLKLRAASANAIGLAFVAIGFIQPLVSGDYSFTAVLKLVICAAIGYIFHNYAMQLLERMED